jgi:hypothetical protein
MEAVKNLGNNENVKKGMEMASNVGSRVLNALGPIGGRLGGLLGGGL